MDLEELISALSEEYDLGVWWPSESPFEVMVGAILTQQTNWNSVSRSLEMMRRGGLLEVDKMAECDLAVLEEMVRPTGFYRQKASRLRSMAGHIQRNHGSDVSSLLQGETMKVREELLSLPGIGNETADSILLFGAGRPKFVAAAYVSRLLDRTGIFSSKDYMDLQGFVESELPPDVTAYRRTYALCVHHCQRSCLRRPRCNACAIAGRCATGLRR
ncbi:MAG: endonuclease III [Methanomassiliicoccales archaeon PtaU1.Bin124]|nr:MAG: endonuclease III [Methanomassiliicoccales archaeon PtaU1.Bin124]